MSSRRFYQAVKERGFILYPGKLTTVETFRVGCMGQLGAAGMPGAVTAIGAGLESLGIKVPRPERLQRLITCVRRRGGPAFRSACPGRRWSAGPARHRRNQRRS